MKVHILLMLYQKKKMNFTYLRWHHDAIDCMFVNNIITYWQTGHIILSIILSHKNSQMTTKWNILF